jgi:hypothetical protein
MAVYWSVSPQTPILSGHWMCAQSIMLRSCCHRPTEVVKVSGTTVTSTDGVERKTVGKNRVEFFADSYEEAMAVYELEKAKYDAIRAAEKRITAEYDAQIETIAPRPVRGAKSPALVSPDPLESQ